MTSSHGDAIAQAVAGNGKGPLKPETIDRLRKAQAGVLDSRWESMLEDLRRRAPFRNLPAIEQDRAFLRLARLSSVRKKRKHPKPVNRSGGMSECSPGWTTIAVLDGEAFTLGSADVPNVVAANDFNPNDNITGNSSVAVTFPEQGQIGLGAAAGGWCDVVWDPSQTLFRMQGNRASAFLTQGFYVPNLATLAPGALSASCTVLLPPPYFALVAGDPKQGDLSSLVYICGQATLDVVACNIVDAIFGAPNPSKSATDQQELFIEQAIGVEDAGTSNALGGSWDTVIEDVDPSGFSSAYELAATISQPLATSDFVVVTVTVEVSAWSIPAIQSIAIIDITGEDTGYPILTAPGYIPPYSGPYAGTTSAGTQPIQVTGLRLCGI